MNFKKVTFFVLPTIFVSLIIFFSSILNIYDNRDRILKKFGYNVNPDYHHEKRYLVNPLKTSDRQLPPTDIKDLKINTDAHLYGQWSAPFDWNVVALHSVLLPDETVMTYGSFGIEKQDESIEDLKSNKKIELTNGKILERDGGDHQWKAHTVFSGIDFDIWDPSLGVQPNAHTLIKKPVVMDAFCSVVRILSPDEVFILGGNKNVDENQPDTQNATMIYNIKNKKFELSKNLNLKRWYGSVVITGDQKMLMIGGTDIVTGASSSTPEIVDLQNIDKGWRLLEKAKSYDLFDSKDSDEWNYPRSFLASDGNVVGLSYNKLWVMDKDNDYRVFKTGEIPLVKGGIAKKLKHENPNFSDDTRQNLQLLTIGSAVGSTNSVIMIDVDKILVFGGKQVGDEYSPSNKVFMVDFSNSFKPIVTELNSMKSARSNLNATILPDGKIFLNGGHSYNEFEFSSFVPEIYDPNTEISIEMDRAYFRRNYHATSLLLPDGRILVAGGDVWNAEIFYPSYLFTKDFKDKTILAERPEITNLDKEIKRGENLKIETIGNISKVTLISTGSTTHAQGSESKFRNLKFSKISETEIEVEITSNPNDLQNGAYLMFVINSNGVPSKGKIVYLN
jgi:hypothetical protein